MRVFPIEVQEDGIYVKLRLDADEYERLTLGQKAKDWDTDQQVIRGSTPPGEAAVFLEALGEHIASYARAMSRS
jgi:hypothetical protein